VRARELERFGCRRQAELFVQVQAHALVRGQRLGHPPHGRSHAQQDLHHVFAAARIGQPQEQFGRLLRVTGLLGLRSALQCSGLPGAGQRLTLALGPGLQQCKAAKAERVEQRRVLQRGGLLPVGSAQRGPERGDIRGHAQAHTAAVGLDAVVQAQRLQGTAHPVHVDAQVALRIGVIPLGPQEAGQGLAAEPV